MHILKRLQRLVLANSLLKTPALFNRLKKTTYDAKTDNDGEYTMVSKHNNCNAENAISHDYENALWFGFSLSFCVFFQPVFHRYSFNMIVIIKKLLIKKAYT